MKSGDSSACSHRRTSCGHLSRDRNLQTVQTQLTAPALLEFFKFVSDDLMTAGERVYVVSQEIIEVRPVRFSDWRAGDD